MLFLFNKTRYGALVRLIVGVAILVFGIADHARVALVLGAVLIAWGLFLIVSARRAREEGRAR